MSLNQLIDQFRITGNTLPTATINRISYLNQTQTGFVDVKQMIGDAEINFSLFIQSSITSKPGQEQFQQVNTVESIVTFLSII